MKFLVLKFLTVFLYLITTSLSYSIEKPEIKNAPSNHAVIGRYILPSKIFNVH